MSSIVMFLLFLVVFSFSSVHATEAGYYIPECVRPQPMYMHSFGNARVVHSNDKCTLTCCAGSKTLSTSQPNQGYVCYPVSQRKCLNGNCGGITSEAVHECSNLHRLDLTQYQTTGTKYSADQCTLKCVIFGKVASVNPVNEGLTCGGTVQNGTCRNGSCMTTTSIPTPVPFTPSTYKINNITLVFQAALKYALGDTDVVQIESTNCLTENIPYKASKIAWNQICLWNYSFGNPLNKNSFYLRVNKTMRAVHYDEYTYTLIGKHLLSQPDSAAKGKLEFNEVFQFFDFKNNFATILADLYVKFTVDFHKIEN